MFITEHLTRAASNIFFEARKLVKARKLTTAWTHKGLVNVKFSQELQEKPTTVRCIDDLNCVMSDLFVNVRKFLTDKKITSTWVHSGQIFVKFTSGATERPTAVRCINDLNSY